MMRRLVAANWKMNKSVAEAVQFVDTFLGLVDTVPEKYDIVLCPPFTALAAVGERLRGASRVQLGAQNMHWEPNGAFTGEISPGMLLELGVRFVILGHSERRQYFGESDEYVRRKVFAALRCGLTPIVAVGETLAEHDDGRTYERVVDQTRAALEGLDRSAVSTVVMAYEPIWAIGTGRNCDAGAANDVMRAIRESVPGLEEVPILYGGSVKPENIPAYVAQPNINGGLVGGASLDPNGFVALMRAACDIAHA